MPKCRKTIFNMAAVRYHKFEKIAVMVTIHNICMWFFISDPNYALIGQYGAEIAKKTIFNMASTVRPPSWICYDVIILHQKTAFYVPNFVLNFHDVRFRICEIPCTSCFSMLAWNCLFRASFWRFLVKNRQKCQN